MPARVPPRPVVVDIFDVVEELAIELVECIVLWLLAVVEIEGPASAKPFAFDRFPLYWTSNGNCQRSAVVCSKLWLNNCALSCEFRIAWS